MKSLTLQDRLAFLGAIQNNESLPSIGGKKIRTVTKYKAGQALDLASNNGHVILPSTLKKVGETNFENGNSLPEGKEFLVSGIRVVFETTATDINLATWKSAAPVAFKNGELTISQDGQGILFQTSGTDVCNSAASTSNDDDFREITPFKLRGATAFNIVFNTAGTVAAGIYKVELRGEEIVSGAQA